MDENQYLSITGQAAHVHDKKIIDAIWEDGDQRWYENGRNDENVVALKITIEDAYYWDEYEQKSKSFYKE